MNSVNDLYLLVGQWNLEWNIVNVFTTFEILHDFSLCRVLRSAAIVEDYSKEGVGNRGNKGTEGQHPVFWISWCKKLIMAASLFKIIFTRFFSFLIKCHLSVEPIWAPSVSSTFLCLLQGFRSAPERLKEKKVNGQL